MIEYDRSLERAIQSIKIGVGMVLCWPPRPDATKANLILRDILWIIALLFPTCAYVLLILTARVIESDPVLLTKVFSQISVISITLLKMINCRIQRSRLQTSVEDLYQFIKMATKNERDALQCCLRKCTPMYSFITVMTFSACAIYVSGPLYLPQPFPSDIIYPDAWKPKEPISRALIYAFEITTISIAGSALLVDLEIAMILWYYSIRFHLLGEEFAMAITSQKFYECIRKHQKLVQSVGEAIIPARYIALELILVTILGVPSSAYQIFAPNQSLIYRIRSFALFCCTAMEVLLYAWPADNLMAASENIAWSVYSSPWMNEVAEAPAGIFIVMLRAQKQITLHIDGVLPILNLDFYGKYLTTSFSYFTTLRAVMA